MRSSGRRGESNAREEHVNVLPSRWLMILLGAAVALGVAVTTAAAQGTLPQDLEYEIIKQSSFQSDRRSVDVRLSRAVEAEALEVLAMRIRDQAPGFDRTFIAYYLPGMEVDGGAWATSHFNPELEVRVLGTPADGGSTVDQLRREYGEALVGIWVNNSPGLSGTYAIYETESGFGLTHVWPDGSAGHEELVEESSSLGRRFREVDNTADEFYLIRGGELQLHDDLGVIWKAQPVGDPD